MFIVCFYANKLDLDTTSVHFNMAFCSCLVCNASWLKGEKKKQIGVTAVLYTVSAYFFLKLVISYVCLLISIYT